MERRPFGSTKREVAVIGQGPGTSIGAIAGPRWPRCAWASIWKLPTSHDLFHLVMARVREQAGSVEVMRDAAARRVMELGEGLGALLRYRRPTPRAAGDQREAARA